MTTITLQLRDRRDLEGGTMPSVVENDVLISPLAGKPAPKDMLVDLAHLEREYFERRPDLEEIGRASCRERV